MARWAKETVIIVVTVLVVSAVVRAFLLQAFFVPSVSMEDTLRVDDRILVSKITTAVAGVDRGEVVVFHDPGGWLPPAVPVDEGPSGVVRTGLTFLGLLPSDTGADLVKRVIAIGGDRISCCDVDGRIVLNGVPLVEDYIVGRTDQVWFDVVVPAGGVFVMGDNRAQSRDSRFHLQDAMGSVPVANIVGRAILIVWPVARWATLPVPDVFAAAPITRGARPTS